MRKISYCVAIVAVTLGLVSCGSPEKEQYRQAQEDLEKGYYEDALSGFQEAVSNELNVAQAYRGQGIALLRLNRYQEAIDAFKSAIAQDEGSKDFQRDLWMYKATAEYKNGDLPGALVSAQAAEGLNADAQCHLLLGRLQLEADNYEEAQKSFEEAVSQEDSYDMYIDVYQAYMQKDMEADGEAYLHKALNKGARDSEDYYQRGRIYYFMEDTDNAVKELIQASNDGNGEACLLLGKVYLAQGDAANARVMYQQYMKEGENSSAQGYNGLALCDMAQEDYDSALVNISKGLEIAEASDVKDLMFNEVVAYEKKLDFATARDKIAEYLKLYPDDEEAQREQEFLLHR